MSKRKFLVTAALPYINNIPHMGHIAGSHLPADIFHRCAKANGFESHLIGGSDEHGTPSVVAAKELGVSPRRLVDSLHEIHKRIYEKMGISYSLYSRTSEPSHGEMVSGFFEKIDANGHIRKGNTRMFYCEKDGMFLPDRFVKGGCPKCGYGDANADQCEQCGTVLLPHELVEPRCRTCGSEPCIRESQHLFIDLKAMETPLIAWVGSKKGVWREHVLREAQRWLAEGLQERSITRDLKWGIRVPKEGFQDKVFYVWFDAPISYMSFTRQLDEMLFQEVWKNEGQKDRSVEIVHFLGKDNIPFHTIFWPAMLLAHGGLNLPSNVVGYNYLMYEKQKFSKSKGIGVFCYNLLDEDGSPDIDSLRGYLASVIPETKDASFRWEDYRAFVNSELVGKFGNFFNRTLSMIHRYFEGKAGSISTGTGDDVATEDMMRAIKTIPSEIGELVMRAEIRKALSRLMEFASTGNTYLDRRAPWKEVSVDPAEADKTLLLALNVCRSLSICGAPFFPSGMERFWKNQLMLEGSPLDDGVWDSATQADIIRSGHMIGQNSPVFPKVDEPGLAALRIRMAKPYSLSELVKGK